MKLGLMSRRPFSLMLKEIGCNGNYTNFFIPMFMKSSQGTIGNRSFFSFYKVPLLFARTNYGEQFFSPSTGQYVPLLWLLPSFEETFLDKNTNYEEKLFESETGRIKPVLPIEVKTEIAEVLRNFRTNRDIVTALLAQGVISTTMIRNFKLGSTATAANLFANYYQRSIMSLDTPEEKRVQFSGTDMSLIPWNRDVLSPPLLQSLNNSMGLLNKHMEEEERRYGEAIVEIRSIRNVATRFLRSYHENPQMRLGEFLTTPDALERECTALFDFLSSFGDKNFLDFSVGLPYAVLGDGM